MRRFDVHLNVNTSADLHDDALLLGATTAEPALAELLEGVRDLGRGEPPSPSAELMAMFEHGLAPAAGATARKAAQPRRLRGSVGRWSARIAAVSTPLALKAGLAAAAMAATGGLAAAGALPPPLQRVASEAAALLKIDLPQGAGASDEAAAEAFTGAIVRPPADLDDVLGRVGRGDFPRRAGASRSDADDDAGDRDRRRRNRNRGGDTAAVPAERAERDERRRRERAQDEAEDRADDEADEAEDRVEDEADRARDRVEEEADQAQDRSEDAADDAEDRAEDGADDAEDRAEDGADDRADHEADEADDQPDHGAGGAEDRARDEADDAEDVADDDATDDARETLQDDDAVDDRARGGNEAPGGEDGEN